MRLTRQCLGEPKHVKLLVALTLATAVAVPMVLQSSEAHAPQLLFNLWVGEGLANTLAIASGLILGRLGTSLGSM